MTDQHAAKSVTSPTLPTTNVKLSAAASANAPFLYFDTAPNFGFDGSVANITLEALRYIRGEDSIVTDRVAIAHLRMSFLGLHQLKRAVDGILLLASAGSEGEAN